MNEAMKTNIHTVSKRTARGCLLFLLAVAAVACQRKPDLPRFAVISDTHFGRKGATEKVPRALKHLLGKQPQVDAIFVVGDLCNSGEPAEFDELLSVFGDRTCVPEGVAVYYMIAGIGHDIKRSAGKVRAAGIPSSFYLDKLGQPAHQFVDIKGYPFITISGEGKSGSDYDPDAQDYLAQKMAEAAQKYPGKPIFVFVHEPPLGTCYGSSVLYRWGSDNFTDILNKYPQAIVFCGHSHYPAGDPRSIHQGVFTTVNDGSTTCSEVDNGEVSIGNIPENANLVTEGLIVQVLSGGDVEIARWDTYRNEEMLPRWLVKAPHDGSNFTYKDRNGLPAPVFAPDAKLTGALEDESYVITFPQATDNEVVHHYLIELLEDGQSVYSFRKFSQFYLNSQMPSELTESLTGLPRGKTLTPQVRAVDSYANVSAPLQGETFITPAADVPSP
jgi:3',5'-cyclic AMP phosphodiesterase CpdA